MKKQKEPTVCKEPTIYSDLIEFSKDKYYEGKGYDNLTEIKDSFNCNTEDILKVISDNGKTIADFKITEEEVEKSRVQDKVFKFEKNIIDPILNTISKHQVYLTKRANLPQLAKLGYLYDALWYAGRVCWGTKGRLGKSYDCEDNPKYKIEMVNPKNERIENLVYDAWGMHGRDGSEKPLNFEEFKKLFFEGAEISEFDKRMLKVNKTFDEWVELLTDKQYKYHSIYKTRRSVADHLLCTIGNGYGMNKDGYVIQEASGADQDLSLYGDWMNAKFHPEIQTVLEQLFSIPELKLTLDSYAEFVKEIYQKKLDEEKKRKDNWRDILKRVFNGPELPKDSMFGDKKIEDLTDDEIDEIQERYIEAQFSKKTKDGSPAYHPYYPICDYSIIDIMINKDSLKREGIKKVHQSYIDAGIEICKEILAHQKEENKERKGNVEFAKKFLAVVGDKTYQEFIPKEVDKDDILRKIKKEFSIFKHPSVEVWGSGIQMDVSFSDKRKNQYANDTYNVNLKFKAPRLDLPFGFGNNIEYLKGTPIYNSLKSCIYNVTAIEDIKHISFFFENSPEKIEVSITMYLDDKYVSHEEDKRKSEEAFIKDGFLIGQGVQALILDKMNLILLTHKSETLGSTHPDNKAGKDYFSQAKYFEVGVITMVPEPSWKVILKYNIDERGYNTFRSEGGAIKKYPEVHNWIMEEFKKLKASDPAYGTYDDQKRKGEGKRKLYAFEFMKWLRDHPLDLKASIIEDKPKPKNTPTVKTKVFAYNGYIGIQSDPDAEGLIAKPEGSNLGCVCDASKIEISEDALELLKRIKKGSGGLGEIDVFKANDGMVVFGWLGGYMKAFKPHEIEMSRDYDPSLLTSTKGVETPKDFIKFVDSLPK